MLIVSAISAFSVSAIAGTMGDAADTYSVVMTLSGGPAWYSEGQSQTVQLGPDTIKRYSPNSKTHATGTGELFLGLSSPITPQWIGQLGLALAYTGTGKLQGDIWEDADPAFNNYYYNYKLSSTRVAVKAKLIANMDYFVQPYMSGSAGVGINSSRSFTITPKIFPEVAAPPFRNHTNTSFSYTAGVGLQAPVNEQWVVGVGYEFADTGKSSLNSAQAQQTANSVQLSHFYTNELQFSITYSCNL